MRPLSSGICEYCGVPNIWAKNSVLDGDNTSLQKMIPMRGVFYEVEEISRLVEGLERELGIPLTSIIFTAHKRAVKRFFQGTLEGVTGALARAAVPGAIFKQQARVAPSFGVGTMSVAAYERGSRVVVEASNVWHERLFAADVAGAFEAVERSECEVDFQRVGDGFRFVAQKNGGEREEYRNRLLPMTGTLMGTPEYPRCHECGSPVSFQVFRWDRDLGTITERDNGQRVVHQTIACFDSMLQEMVDELGEEMRELAVRVHADYVREKVSSGVYDAGGEAAGDTDRRLFDYLSLIRRRCMGNPILIDLTGEELRVNIRNPANEELLVGRVLGTYEAVMGTRASARGELSGRMLRVGVRS